jgi:hypothetical protein
MNVYDELTPLNALLARLEREQINTEEIVICRVRRTNRKGKPYEVRRYGRLTAYADVPALVFYKRRGDGHITSLRTFGPYTIEGPANLAKGGETK